MTHLEIAENLINRWDVEGQYETDCELSFYIETLINEYQFEKEEAMDLIMEHIDLDSYNDTEESIDLF